MPRWVLKENRQNCSFCGKMQITFGCSSQSLTGTPSVLSSVSKCYGKKSKPGRAEPPHRPFSRSPPLSFKASKGIHLLSQNGCLCAAQPMSLSHEIQRAGHCHPEMEHKKPKNLKLSLVVSGSRGIDQLLRCLTSMYKVLGSIPSTA